MLTRVYVIVVFTLFFKLGAFGSFFDDTPRCEPLDVRHFNICYNHGYKRTMMPNFVGHSSQKEASRLFGHFVQLIERNCSSYLSFFMCAVHAPVCFKRGDFELVLKPCRNVCESARAGCDSVMRQFANVRWDDSYDGRLNCNNFPDVADALCIPTDMKKTSPQPTADTQGTITAMDPTTVSPTSPEVPSPTPTEELRKPVTEPPKVKTRCEKCPKRIRANFRNYRNGNFVFAIKGQMLKFKRRNGKKVIQLQLQKIFNQSSVPMATTVTGITELWTNGVNKCSCPKMDTGKTYLICGYEDITRDRLLLPSNSLVAEWEDRLDTEIPKWLRKLEKQRTKQEEPISNGVPVPPPKQIGKKPRKYRIRKTVRTGKR